MPTLAVGFYIAFAVLSAAHILARYLGYNRFAVATKPALVPLLIIASAIWQSAHGFTWVGTLICISLFLGWVGDVILIKQSDLALVIGGLGFGIGHICTITSIIIIFTHLSKINLSYMLMHLAFVVLVIISSYYVLKDFDRANPRILRSIGPYLIVYIVLLTSMFLLTSTLAGQDLTPYYSLAFLGAFSFYLSDWTLLRSEFKGVNRFSQGTVMLLYLFGQFGLSYGLYAYYLQVIA